MVTLTYKALEAHNQAEIKTAGPRYTPSQDPKAPNLIIQELEESFDILALSHNWDKLVKDLKVDFEKGLENQDFTLKKVFKNKKQTPEKALALLRKVESSNLSNVEKTCKALSKVLTSMHRSLESKIKSVRSLKYELEKQASEFKKQDNTVKYKKVKAKTENLEREISDLNKADDAIRSNYEFYKAKRINLLSQNLVLLTGEWGTGKTHFLCDYTKRLVAAKHPCFFSIAQNSPTGINPLKVLCDESGLANNITDLLAKLNAKGHGLKRRALLIIDGINEGDREHWQKAVNELVVIAKNYPYVGVILSCRSPFEEIIFSKKELKKFYRLRHYGFNEIEFEAQESFFKYYKIPFPEVPLLSEEFSRPLTIKLICSSLQRLTKEKRKKTFEGIASGQKGMTFILESYIIEAGMPIEKKYKLPEKFCWLLIKGGKSKIDGSQKGIAARLAEKLVEVLSIEETFNIIEALTGWTDRSRIKALLKDLVHGGILFEHYIYSADGIIDAVRLPYQKFSDHIIARHLLKVYLKTDSEKSVRRSFYSNKKLGQIFTIDEHHNFNPQYLKPNWAEALMIEFPERIKNLKLKNRELLYFLPKRRTPVSALKKPFLDSLLWRPTGSFTEGTEKILSWMLSNLQDQDKADLYDVLLALAVIYALLIADKDKEKFKKRYREDIDSGWDSPSPAQDHYTFAGEAPWSPRFATYLKTNTGKIRQNIYRMFRKSKFVPFAKKDEVTAAEEETTAEMYEELLNTLRADGHSPNSEGEIENADLSGSVGEAYDALLENIRSGKLKFTFTPSAPEGKWTQSRGIAVEVLSWVYAWESYHSSVNDFRNFEYPAPAVIDYLKLNYKNRSVELFDASGRKATIYARTDNDDDLGYRGSSFLFIREDLLNRYLIHTGQSLLWTIEGRRDTHHDYHKKRKEEVIEEGVYKEHRDSFKMLYEYD